MQDTPQTLNDKARESWRALQQHAANTANDHILDYFHRDPARVQSYSLTAAGLTLDYSKNRANSATLEKLVKLAEDAGMKKSIDAMFAGEPINHTEGRAVLHTALRSSSATPVLVDGQDIKPEIRSALAQMEQFVSKVHRGEWLGYSGKPINDVVSIGIGGSYLGPRVAVEALRPYWQENIRCHFVSNVDGSDIAYTLENLNPETTLFIVQSKSFTTQETLANSMTAREWYLREGGSEAGLSKHFVAVSSNVQRARDFGIDAENVFPMWDWVGGRYSLWSAIGLPIALQVGMKAFRELLAGAEAMDQHFKTAPLEQNMPVLMGMLGIWYHNFLGADSYVILPYDQTLENLPAHLQQVDMESNGKGVNRAGVGVDYATGPIIWGGAGTNGQHAYHQLLHQGTRWTPADFILPLKSHKPAGRHHAMLASNCFAQSQALMCGKSLEKARQELLDGGMSSERAEELAPHKVIPGNRPSNTLVMDEINPHTLGALIALYEQKVFVQGVIWNLNSFDQWGVELGKQLSDSILPMLLDTGASTDALDPSSAALVEKFRKANGSGS
ncbi:glucose-6-phosphate isomerase [Hahella sp. KA22]|uniref:glucose-6-phosphate isomerase n=1 Tax=Hahella sp. KA22 TaxID=1628392 RepID=UPI000FDF508B|nr:glucose-6-phosphate isomerase [Hahella sp. KA22]AZZ94660.1 glucose-6-phosphate isomerase [Hahella sp. KA22]QAY58033.1 glucose-6-phosphate isomerase [Hahella sp. KA22]